MTDDAGSSQAETPTGNAGSETQAPGTTPPPGERRLARPPSDRYRPESPADAVADAPPGSVGRGVAWGLLAAIVGGIAITIGGGLAAITAGLLVIAGVVGWGVAASVVSGTTARVGRNTRVTIATVLALLGVALGQVGLWLLARQEGGVLSLIDYLAETFGILVPFEFAIAAVVAWWRAR